MTPKTLYEKIWDSHVVREEPGKPALIYIDRHLIHEGTSPQAFAGLKAEGRTVRRPDLTFAVMDHSVPTKDRLLPIVDLDAKAQFDALERNCRETSVRLFDMHSKNQALCISSGRSSVSPSPAKPLFAVTATRRRTAHSAPLLSVSARVRWSTYWQRSVWCRTNRRLCRLL